MTVREQVEAIRQRLQAAKAADLEYSVNEFLKPTPLTRPYADEWRNASEQSLPMPAME